MSTWISRTDLDELIGQEAASILCRLYGGIQFYVPKRVRNGERLAGSIGFGRALALCNAYGGGYIVVPLDRPEPLKVQIVRLLKKGKRAPDIARKLGTTERYVRRIMSEQRNSSTWLTLT